MTGAMRGYIRAIEGVNRRLGRVVMYGIFAIMGILLWSSISKTFFNPSLWTFEMAQFAMVAYYILGGPYAIQTDANVRMDLFYGSWSSRGKVWTDAITVMFLIVYLGVLLWGGIDSTIYSFRYGGERSPHRLAAVSLAHQGSHGDRNRADAAAGGRRVLQGRPSAPGRGGLMSYELIAILMFSTMMIMLATGQRVFGAIGFVAVLSALLLWGDRGGYDLGFAAAMKLMKWYPLLTLPMFIFMGYVLSESKIADDLYRMFHVWTGGMAGGLAMGTIGLMVLISAMNGLSVAGMAIGATIALPELLKRNYDKRMVTGVIQAGSSLGILVPPSVVLVLYAMIARQPVGATLACGHRARAPDGRALCPLHLAALPDHPQSRPRTPQGRAQRGAEREISPSARRPPATVHLRGDDRALRQRLDFARRILCHRWARRLPRRGRQAPDDT